MRLRIRTFTGVAVMLLTLAIGAEAQPPVRAVRIGWLAFGSSPTAPQGTEIIGAFRQGLREAGWIEGQNCVIEYRAAEGRAERFADLAADLVRLPVDVIVTASGEPAILAAKRARLQRYRSSWPLAPIRSRPGSSPVSLGPAGMLRA